MRQAGRYLPEYRALRAKHSLLELCHTPDLAAEITLQPVRRFAFDAAILFADILLPFEPLGLGLSFAAGEGPRIERPIRDAAAVRGLPRLDPEEGLGYVLEAVRILSRELPPQVPLIGFAGAPFTLASYAIEGGPSRDFARTKAFMYREPVTWHLLLDRLADLVGRYLAAQARAGAQALQLFDSWVGCLSPADYRAFVLRHSRKALALAAAAQVPVIHFGTDTAGFLEDFGAAGGDVVGVDWRLPLDVAWARLGGGEGKAIQGNLDPIALLGPHEVLRLKIREVLDRAGRRPGHIFNLGHGVVPETPVEAVELLVEQVHGE
jgi:uroporphyrinogen decarboxylase